MCCECLIKNKGKDFFYGVAEGLCVYVCVCVAYACVCVCVCVSKGLTEWLEVNTEGQSGDKQLQKTK